MGFSRYISTVAAAAVLVATAPQVASALTVKLEEAGGASLTIVDGDSNDSNTFANAVNFSGSLGAFTVTLSSATSNDDPTSSDLNSVGLDINGAGMLTISVSDIGFGGGAGSPLASNLSFEINGTKIGDMVEASAYVDLSNALFGTADQIGSTLSFAGGAPFGDGTNDTAVLSDPFSMTTVIKITQTAGQKTSFDATAVAAVPLPAGGLLLLTALGGMAALRRRRKAA